MTDCAYESVTTPRQLGVVVAEERHGMAAVPGPTTKTFPAVQLVCNLTNKV